MSSKPLSTVTGKTMKDQRKTRGFGSFFTSLLQHLISNNKSESGFPGHIQGIFEYNIRIVDVFSWREWLQKNPEGALDCRLDEVILCKCKDGKQHEFTLLRFRWKTSSKVAFVTADRAPRAVAEDNSQGISSSTPSTPPTSPAVDVVHMVPQSAVCRKFLTKINGPYDELCKLEFLSSDARPSSLQVSVLLDVVNQHAPNCGSYQNQCYWFANTVFNALLKLFPSSEERCCEHERRANHTTLNVPKQDSVDAVCEEYIVEWQKEQDKEKIEEEKQREAEEKKRQILEEIAQIKAETARYEAETARYKAEIARLKAKIAQSEAETAQSEAETAQSEAQIAQSEARIARSRAEAVQGQKEQDRKKIESDKKTEAEEENRQVREVEAEAEAEAA